MDLFRATEISASGMVAQKTRIEAAASNLANMHSAQTAGAPAYQPLTAVIRSKPASFASALSGSHLLATAQVELQPQAGAALRSVYEPGHPDADAAGMVSYPAVDHLREMLTVMTAMRAYEANLAALQATKTMASRALDIGGQ